MMLKGKKERVLINMHRQILCIYFPCRIFEVLHNFSLSDSLMILLVQKLFFLSHTHSQHPGSETVPEILPYDFCHL